MMKGNTAAMPSVILVLNGLGIHTSQIQLPTITATQEHLSEIHAVLLYMYTCTYMYYIYKYSLGLHSMNIPTA